MLDRQSINDLRSKGQRVLILHNGIRKYEMSDNFERKVISPAEREARKAFKEVDTAKVLTEQERAQKAFQENRERLRALRLAREAERHSQS
jgi:hypothetical protein